MRGSIVQNVSTVCNQPFDYYILRYYDYYHYYDYDYYDHTC